MRSTNSGNAIDHLVFDRMKSNALAKWNTSCSSIHSSPTGPTASSDNQNAKRVPVSRTRSNPSRSSPMSPKDHAIPAKCLDQGRVNCKMSGSIRKVIDSNYASSDRCGKAASRRTRTFPAERACSSSSIQRHKRNTGTNTTLRGLQAIAYGTNLPTATRTISQKKVATKKAKKASELLQKLAASSKDGHGADQACLRTLKCPCGCSIVRKCSMASQAA